MILVSMTTFCVLVNIQVRKSIITSPICARQQLAYPPGGLFLCLQLVMPHHCSYQSGSFFKFCIRFINFYFMCACFA